MIKAITFDLDGTLINTVYSLNETINRLMDKYNLEKITLDETKLFIGNGYKIYVEKAINKSINIKKDPSLIKYLAECQKDYLEIFKETSTYNLKIYDGILETIKYLKENNIKVICITNKPHNDAIKVLNKAFDNNTFDLIIGDDGIRPLKPNPLLLDIILNEFKINKNEIIHVGDTKTDMEFANNANIKSIGCAYGFRGWNELEKYNPTYIVNNAFEILAIIKKYCDSN